MTGNAYLQRLTQFAFNDVFDGPNLKKEPIGKQSNWKEDSVDIIDLDDIEESVTSIIEESLTSNNIQTLLNTSKPLSITNDNPSNDYRDYMKLLIQQNSSIKIVSQENCNVLPIWAKSIPVMKEKDEYDDTTTINNLDELTDPIISHLEKKIDDNHLLDDAPPNQLLLTYEAKKKRKPRRRKCYWNRFIEIYKSVNYNKRDEKLMSFLLPLARTIRSQNSIPIPNIASQFLRYDHGYSTTCKACQHKQILYSAILDFLV